ncbi:hypothetical protein [Pseudaminobacter sp. NGMCC 1.201702]
MTDTTDLFSPYDLGGLTAFAWVVFGGTVLAAAAFFPVLRIGKSGR